MVTNKECKPKSDAAERSGLSGSTLFALNTGIYVKHSGNKNQNPATGNTPDQRVVVKESTRRRLVK